MLEVDGAAWHTDPPRDQDRDNRLAALGWRVVRPRWSQIVDHPGWVRLVRRALDDSHQ